MVCFSVSQLGIHFDVSYYGATEMRSNENMTASHMTRYRFSVYIRLRARLHLESASMLQQLCNDTINPVLTEHNGVASQWGCNPFWSNCTVFNQTRIASVITVL